jgi:hypothetical protein
MSRVAPGVAPCLCVCLAAVAYSSLLVEDGVCVRSTANDWASGAGPSLSAIRHPPPQLTQHNFPPGTWRWTST